MTKMKTSESALKRMSHLKLHPDKIVITEKDDCLQKNMILFTQTMTTTSLWTGKGVGCQWQWLCHFWSRIYAKKMIWLDVLLGEPLILKVVDWGSEINFFQEISVRKKSR